ncbi:hypothetical protein BKA67DRAFT_582990 [Truncatella angustata]|uniref:Uncharacterized protein n=1 Tax=Truncatella angustata TaxID=152316 RepID=A0A9P8RL14_9PEZI|nr:uncharacterized protein BKA67DRAFT_582990 [Truncatella angustata]KAH6646021.1 hypothetical protein BKA67DRAFT_582990 [Truncatella angustata]
MTLARYIVRHRSIGLFVCFSFAVLQTGRQHWHSIIFVIFDRPFRLFLFYGITNWSIIPAGYNIHHPRPAFSFVSLSQYCTLDDITGRV